MKKGIQLQPFGTCCNFIMVFYSFQPTIPPKIMHLKVFEMMKIMKLCKLWGVGSGSKWHDFQPSQINVGKKIPISQPFQLFQPFQPLWQPCIIIIFLDHRYSSYHFQFASFCSKNLAYLIYYCYYGSHCLQLTAGTRLNLHLLYTTGWMLSLIENIRKVVFFHRCFWGLL